MGKCYTRARIACERLAIGFAQARWSNIKSALIEGSHGAGIF